MPELLLELLSEEIPARMQAKAADDLKRLIGESLKKDGFEFSDIETATLELFVQAWWEKFGEEPVGVGELLPLAQESGLVVTEKSRQSQLVSLGTKLRKQRDRVIGEWRVVCAGKVQGAIRWRLLKRSE